MPLFDDVPEERGSPFALTISADLARTTICKQQKGLSEPIVQIAPYLAIPFGLCLFASYQQRPAVELEVEVLGSVGVMVFEQLEL